MAHGLNISAVGPQGEIIECQLQIISLLKMSELHKCEGGSGVEGWGQDRVLALYFIPADTLSTDK